MYPVLHRRKTAEWKSTMKQQRHKRRESFSVLLISNVDRSNRQFSVSLTFIRLIFFLILLILAVIGILTFLFLAGNQKQNMLRAQLTTQEAMVEQLNAEKDVLDNEIQALRAENNDLRQVSKIITTKREEAAAEEAPASNPLPTLFPSSGSGILIETYSEDRPYRSINTHTEGKIVATGDGTVVTVGSDDTYPLILEIEHENGYKTRYMCNQDVQVQTEEGSQVKAGDLLCTIIDKLDLVIEDNGIGINESDLPMVFKKSFTGQNGRTKSKSTGMGLFIAKSLCDKLGHKINVESEEGKYTKVIITFSKNNYYDVVK